ncbi:MAG: RagB/SusD family nutrient uptake outer membrane protein [Bacteroidales bacterium]
MKKIFYILMIIIAGTLSCEDDLTLNPVGSNTPEKNFANEKGAEAALLGMYNNFSPGYFMFSAFKLESYGNTGTAPGPDGDENMYRLVVTPETRECDRWWNETYPTIHQANYFLRYFNPDVFSTETRAKSIVGEVRFLRAMMYFRLVRIFGGIPIITEDTDVEERYPARNTEEEVYQLIMDDLEYGVNNLQQKYVGIYSEEYEEAARVTKGAAMALLAKVLMTAPEPLRDYQRAATLTSEIVNNMGYSLLDKYEDLWMYDNKNNSENIFMISLSQEGNNNGSNIAGLTYPGQTWYRPTDELYNSYESGDQRRDINIFKFIIYPDNYVHKYWYDEESYNESSSFPKNAFPFYYMRLADIILLRAEALARLDWSGNITEITNLINQVRDRAFQGDQTGDYTYRVETTDFASEDDVIRYLADERHKELYFELHYFFDLKRMGLAIEKLSWPDRPMEPYMLYFPLGDEQMTLNPNLKQNTGY